MSAPTESEIEDRVAEKDDLSSPRIYCGVCDAWCRRHPGAPAAGTEALQRLERARNRQAECRRDVAKAAQRWLAARRTPNRCEIVSPEFLLESALERLEAAELEAVQAYRAWADDYDAKHRAQIVDKAIAASAAPATSSSGSSPEASEASSTSAAPVANSLTMEERIRAAYLRVTGGELNQYVRLALLRAELPGEPAVAVDAELRRMQQRGGAVLYPIDDPQRIRPEDDAAALRVSGERRDLVCITRSS